ncbi:hypothetical protein VZQ01_09740 [Myxococcus faecalis]
MNTPVVHKSFPLERTCPANAARVFNEGTRELLEALARELEPHD